MLDGAWLGTDRRQVVLFQSGQELSGNRIDDALSLDHEREQAVLSEVRRCDGGK